VPSPSRVRGRPRSAGWPSLPSTDGATTKGFRGRRLSPDGARKRLRYLFPAAEDRKDFLERIALVCARFELALLAYVLLGNHYHLILDLPDARVSRALQWLHTEYSRDQNRLYGRSAHLFRAHPFAREIESDVDLVGTCRYLARNPVEANLVRDPLAWPWSSARAHAGLERPRIPLDESPVRAAFGGTENWRQNYVTHIRRPNEKGPVSGALRGSGGRI
jgi:REP element-mobilizing transposase RayT